MIQKRSHQQYFLKSFSLKLLQYSQRYYTLSSMQEENKKIEPKKSTARRDKLISLQQRARIIWNRNNFLTVELNEKPKYFMTFPYAYMNGLLHLGHAFSMTKCDFNAWYKRICGFNVLFPFGYHCTGMPIAAASMRLKEELETYGNPPNTPKDTKSQYNILKQMNVPVQDIAKFIDPTQWVAYFPPLARKHLKSFGVMVDHGRSFITTDLNPYYDSFIQWQFNILKEKGKLKFGKRPSIYSPKDKQMCADHDRSQGEGIALDQYAMIKLRVKELNPKMKQSLANRKVYLVAATLRPETMYGQTSCYLLPKGQYCAVEMKDEEVFICSYRSARNMAFQNITKEYGEVQVIAKFKGEEMMGLPLDAPLAVHKTIYTIPMMTISMVKGSGVVCCVPSDSPDDWMATTDLRSKQAFREKYGITEEMISPQPISIIHIPSIGDLSALTICERMDIKSQNDHEKLALAKDECYSKGFHEGTMNIGAYKGKKVSEAKNLVKSDLIESKEAVLYYEPAGKVISRSGDECVGAYCDQWYINYADEQWKKKVREHVKNNFHCNSKNLRKDIEYTIDWLKEWGCSRSFGLGTKLPFSKEYVIESLSDSTIYMAFYTVSHFLQGNLDGSEPGTLGIKKEQLSHDFWDYVFLGKEYTSKKVSMYKMDKLRESFLYWYPMDLRCSGKDLIKNHLTMSLFNHIAIWQDQPDKWPRGFYCNGFINVDNEKMSKSLGNFITMEEAVQDYGADATRLACAQAGDSINDANFTRDVANAAILQLSALEMEMGKSLAEIHLYRAKDAECKQVEFFDQIFQNEIEDQIKKVKESYQNMVYRDVVKYGFHDFTSIYHHYVNNCDRLRPRRDLLERYIFLQLLFLYPVCPHFCEVSYIDYLMPLAEKSKDYPSLLGLCRFPTAKANINYVDIRSHQYIISFLAEMREIKKKVEKTKKGNDKIKISKATIVYRAKLQKYQLNVLKLLQNFVDEDKQEIKQEWRNDIKTDSDADRRRDLRYGAFIVSQFKLMGNQALAETLPFDEKQILNFFMRTILEEFKIEIKIVEIEDVPEREGKRWVETANNVTPGNPTVLFQ